MKINDEMLTAAMKKAVEAGIVPKYTDGETYLRYWGDMKACLEAALGHCQEKKMSAATMNEVERLRTENKRLISANWKLAVKGDQLRQRVAELEAHVEHTPDCVWEALQRLIENAQELGEASQEDALLVSQYRDRHKFLRGESLALRDLIKQAEEDEKLVKIWNGDHEVDEDGGTVATIHTSWLIERAKGYRQDAEALK